MVHLLLGRQVIAKRVLFLCIGICSVLLPSSCFAQPVTLDCKHFHVRLDSDARNFHLYYIFTDETRKGAASYYPNTIEFSFSTDSGVPSRENFVIDRSHLSFKKYTRFLNDPKREVFVQEGSCKIWDPEFKHQV